MDRKIKVVRIINRFNIGGPTFNATFLTKFLGDEFETILIGGVPDEGEKDSLHILKEYGVEPLVIPPNELIHNGKNDLNLLAILRDTSSYLVNLPGAMERLNFNLPEYENVELFLRSEGYYIEWMREDWLKEQDKMMVKMMFLTPRKWLREMAPKYKLVEPVMEELFWSSKFAE